MWFGIVVLDLTKREVKDTYIIGETGSNLEVYDLAFSNTDVYASTADGIRKASLTDPLIALYSSWSKLQNTPVTLWGSAVWWNNLLCIQYPALTIMMIPSSSITLLSLNGRNWLLIIFMKSDEFKLLRMATVSLFLTTEPLIFTNRILKQTIVYITPVVSVVHSGWCRCLL